MARKKQEIALQLEIETQEEWEELLSKEGLIGNNSKHMIKSAADSSCFLFLCIMNHFALVLVIDVYQEWAGPCKSMIQYFRRLRNEIGDAKSLHFAVVCELVYSAPV